MSKKNVSMKEQIKYRMSKNDFYEILDLDGQCSSDDIKRSYKKLAFRFHPDKNTTDGAKDVFNKITNAYSKLSDPKTKAEYDDKSKSNQNKTAFNSNSYRESNYYPFGNQSRFSDFSYHRQKEQEQERRKKYQQQKQDMERQFEKVFRKFFENSRPNQRNQKPRPQHQYQKNQEKQYTERMKRQYQQQRRAKKKKETAEKQQEKKKNILIFFIVLFSLILLGPHLFSFLNTKPPYSVSRTAYYNIERKTKNLQFPYFMNQKQLSKQVSQFKLSKIEEIVDKKMLQGLKKQCINSKQQKKNLQDRAYKQKIGKARNFYLEQAKQIQMVYCDMLFVMTVEHSDYIKSLLK